MTNVWLIFFKNKLKEIGGFLFMVLWVVFFTCCIMLIGCGIVYIIGWSMYKLFPVYMLEILKDPYTTENIMANGIAHLVMVIIVGVVGYCLFYYIPKITIIWLKDNWEKAKDESRINKHFNNDYSSKK